MVIVKLEGQDIQLPDEAAASDDLVRKALVPYFPDVANSEIRRETNDGQTTVTVVKRAGPKGC